MSAGRYTRRHARRAAPPTVTLEGSAGIEFIDGRYFAQMSFVSWGSGDWLAALWKDPGGRWVLVYRFRHRADDKLLGSEDEKVWMVETTDDDVPEEDAVAYMDGVMDMLVAKAGELGAALKIHKLPLRSADPLACAAMLMGQPWFHGRFEGAGIA
jgi:hypothetical protein